MEVRLFLFINRKVCVTRTCNEWPLAYETKHKTFTIMTTNFEVINQMYAATIAANENKAIIDALRPEAEKAIQELLKQQGKPASFTGTIEYNGIKIIVRRPKSFTWEKNTNPAITSDPNHAIYMQQLALQEKMAAELKDMRADLKRTAEKLEKAHPESESIKHAFRIAFGN